MQFPYGLIKGLFKRIQHCWTNIIQQCYYNRYDCFSFKSFWLDKLYSNSKPSLDKKIEKETVWAIISTMLDDVGPTMLDPFKQALKDD